MKKKPLYDIFITHAWRYHEDWTKISSMLDDLMKDRWRNFSLPWHDPAMDPNSTVGRKFIHDSLETQIIPAVGVVFLSGVYAVKSSQKWLDLEVTMAKKHGKPIIGLPPIGSSEVPNSIAEICDRCVPWDATLLVEAIDSILGSSPKSQSNP